MLSTSLRSPLLFLLATLTASVAHGQVFVDDDATGANDGTSWQDAFTTLDAALVHGGLIWVAEGTYKSSNQSSFQLNNRTIYGGFDGTETSFAQRAGLFGTTVLSGDVLGDDGPGFTNRADNVARVVKMSGTAKIDGFTIRGGHTPGNGGGLLVEAFAQVEILNCTFEDCWADNGGGVYEEMFVFSLYENCDFIGNHAEEQGGGLYRIGGTAEATPV